MKRAKRCAKRARMQQHFIDFLQVLALTAHDVPAVRVRALKEMCPCRVKGDIGRFWDRVFEMLHDKDPGVC